MASADVRDKWEWDCIVWFCDFCGDQGGMTTRISHCPQCQHYRCDGCPVEWVHLRRKSKKKAENTTCSPNVLRIPKPSSSAVCPTLPISNLALLQKVSTRPPNLTLRNDIEKHRNSSAANSPCPVPSLDDQACELLDITRTSSSITITPSSTPALSPCSTETSSRSIESSGYASPYSTDIESDETTSQEDPDDWENETETHPSIMLLESRLFSVLGHDLELAAFLIPRIYNQVRFGSGSENYDYTDVTSQGSTRTREVLAEGLGTGSSPTSSSNARTGCRKRNRQRDEDDETNDNGRSKRSRVRLGNPDRRPRFACPFYKKDPEKYCVLTDMKYRPCMGPGAPELRRIKDHFKAAHRASQCDRCYDIFEDIGQLIDHRRSGTCPRREAILKEGIDDKQMDSIENLLKGKRGMSQFEKDNHDIEKWFKIWTILFPDCSPPSHPWNNSVQLKSTNPSAQVESMLNTFESIVELDIGRGNLRRDDEIHQRYVLAVRAMLEMAGAVSSGIESNGPPSHLDPSSASNGLLDFSTNGLSASEEFFPSSSQSSNSVALRDLPPSFNAQNADLYSFVGSNSQTEHSTLSTNPQSNLATQSKTPQGLAKPVTSISFDASADQGGSSTAEAHTISNLPDYELEHTLGLPLQIEWPEELQHIQQSAGHLSTVHHRDSDSGFSSHGFIFGGLAETQMTDFDLEGYQNNTEAFVGNEDLTAMLELELQLPTAMAPFKDHSDRNKGLRKL